MTSWEVITGDCIEAMRGLPDASIDAVVTDPPYGLSFMGKAWDTFDPSTMERRVGRRAGNGPPSDVHDGRSKGRAASAFANPAGEAGAYDFSPRAMRAFQEFTAAWAAEALRVLKPGGHVVSFASTRTNHRHVAGLENAGFEIRDTLAWLFGSGFPKSLNVERGLLALERGEDASDELVAAAAAFEGWGTALKPAYEPITLARKPLIGTVAANVLEHSTGGLNIDGCRISTDEDLNGGAYTEARRPRAMAPGGAPRQAQPGEFEQPTGRWPANVLVDEHAATMLDEQSGQLVSGANPTRRGSDKSRDVYGDFAGQAECTPARGLDIGGASRFYYCAKATRAEREAGLAFMEATGRSDDGYGSIQRPKLDRRSPRENWTPRERRNVHPTVKPIDVMRWLCRLITPAGGTVLDPFAGSGTTGCAAMLEGLRFVGVEREPEYVAIAEGRIAHWLAAGPAALDQPRPRPAAAREDMPTLWDHHETKADEDAA